MDGILDRVAAEGRMARSIKGLKGGRSVFIFVLLLFGDPRVVRCYGGSSQKSRPPSNPLPDCYHDVIIVGGSLVGLATAVAITSPCASPSPPKVAVYERARQTKPIGALLSLFPNGLAALRSVDATVADDVERVSIPSRVSEIRSSTNANGNTLRCVESNTSGEANGGTFICWYQLQNILMSALQSHSPDTVKLGMEFVSYSFNNSTGLVSVTCRDRNNGSQELYTTTCRLLIGADGVHSAVRRQVIADQECVRFNFYNRTIFRALIEVDALDDDFNMPQKGTAVIYKSDVVGQIFKMWPASDGLLAITATVNSNDDNRAIQKWDKEEAKEKMMQVYADFSPEVRGLIRQIPASSIYVDSVCDMDCLQNWSDGPVIIIGDAAHCMTPSIGQGANTGLEDAAEIGKMLTDNLVDLASRSIIDLIKTFVSRRQERVQEIHTASRMQALNKNKKDTALDSFRKQNPAFFEKLYGWQPMGSAK